jgi:hypothetical protein
MIGAGYLILPLWFPFCAWCNQAGRYSRLYRSCCFPSRFFSSEASGTRSNSSIWKIRRIRTCSNRQLPQIFKNRNGSSVPISGIFLPVYTILVIGLPKVVGVVLRQGKFLCYRLWWGRNWWFSQNHSNFLLVLSAFLRRGNDAIVDR